MGKVIPCHHSQFNASCCSAHCLLNRSELRSHYGTLSTPRHFNVPYYNLLCVMQWLRRSFATNACALAPLSATPKSADADLNGPGLVAVLHLRRLRVLLRLLLRGAKMRPLSHVRRSVTRRRSPLILVRRGAHLSGPCNSPVIATVRANAKRQRSRKLSYLLILCPSAARCTSTRCLSTTLFFSLWISVAARRRYSLWVVSVRRCPSLRCFSVQHFVLCCLSVQRLSLRRLSVRCFSLRCSSSLSTVDWRFSF